MLNKGNVVRFLNSKLSDFTGREPKDGLLYGLELELEGRNVAMDGVPSKHWRRVQDGSLRGESVEYIFARPCDYPEAVLRVDKLFKMFKEHDVNLKNSYRTSTHVHLNFSDKTVKQIVTFFLLHTIFEEVFEYYCGDERKGNLFCMSARDNEDLISMLNDALFTFHNFNSFSDNVRYNAANLAALNKFGSIEIRTMRGANTKKEVVEWLDILRQLYEYSCSGKAITPAKITESLSYLGVDGFFGQIFDKVATEALMKTWPKACNVHTSLLNGVRLIQLLSYKLEDVWEEEYKPEPTPAKKAKREEGADRIETPDGHNWWLRDKVVALPIGYEEEINGRNYIFDHQNLIMKNIRTGEPCKWLVFNGRRVTPGSVADRDVNRLYHAWHNLDDDDDNENDIIDFDDDFDDRDI
jgi:hypothetical protein